MKQLLHNIKYHFLSTIRDKSAIFWVMIYPLILSSFFHFGLGSIQENNLKIIKLGTSAENLYNEYFKHIPVLELKEIKESDAKTFLKNRNIDIFVFDDLNVLIRENNINVNIVESIINQLKEMESMGKNFNNYDFTIDYSKENLIENKVVKSTMYTLLGTQFLYGYFMAINLLNNYQANLSSFAARVSASSLKKSTGFFTTFTISFIFNVISNILLMLLITKIYKINIITNLPLTLLIMLSGNLLGISLGLLISITNKFNIDMKTTVGVIGFLLLSFLSGMMGVEVKAFIIENMPILSKINPVSLSMDGLFYANILNRSDLVIKNSLIILGVSFIIITISILYMRRIKYDSI